MATATRCQTPGAVYWVIIGPDRIAVDVDLPFDLALGEDDAALLEANLHNMVELVLAPYFAREGDTGRTV